MDLFDNALRALKRVGKRTFLEILTYSFFKEFQEREFGIRSSPFSQFKIPGEIKNIRSISSGIILSFSGAQLELVFLSSDILRATWSPGILPVPYAIDETTWPDFEVKFEHLNESFSISSDKIRVIVDKLGNIRYFDQDECLLRYDLPPLLQMAGEMDQQELTHSWTHFSDMNPETHIFGMGERAHGFNLNPGTYKNWNRDPEGLYRPGDDPLYLCIPTYVAIHNFGSYLIFYENSFNSTFTFNEDRQYLDTILSPELGKFIEIDEIKNLAQVNFSNGALRYYFIPGHLDQILERYSELTGRPPLPPRWALGYHHSRWGYQSEEDIRQTAEGFVKHNLPVNAIHLDIDYMNGYRVFTVDGDRFPDLSALVSEIGEIGIKLIPILDPGVKVDHEYFLFKEGLDNAYFCKTPRGKIVKAPVWPGFAAFPDFTNPQVRNWWSEKYSLLLQQGVAGIWHDMNEPAVFSAWGDMSLPQSTIHDMDGRGGDHREAHNLYGLLMNRSGHEAQLKIKPKNRPWQLTRSGWASVSRYAWTWTGDIESSWEALRQVIPTILGLSLSGIPYSGSDIGGFSGIPSAELYQRWFQLSSFIPFFRTHSSIESPSREPWTFDDETLQVIRKFLNLRYQLLPYIYTLAWEASAYGYPLVRPIFWPHFDDPEYWSIDDQFLLGDSLLIAPILKQGRTSRKVNFPPGVWFDFWEDKMFKGPDNILVEVELDQIPVFVRAGCVLPLEKNEMIQLHVYPISNGETRSFMFSDEGDGFGPSRIDYFDLRGQENQIVMNWTEVGDFPFNYDQVIVSFHGFNPHKVVKDGSDVQIKDNKIKTSKFKSLRIFHNLSQ